MEMLDILLGMRLLTELVSTLNRMFLAQGREPTPEELAAVSVRTDDLMAQWRALAPKPTEPTDATV